jgi:C-terminal processing protease CtpA/Prc
VRAWKNSHPTLLALCGLLHGAGCGPATWPGGVHARLAWSERGVRVVDVPADTPAARGGLRAGDRLLEVDGRSLEGLSAQEVQKLLSGEVGSTAKLEVLRDGARQEVAIEREPYATKGAAK